MPIERLLGWALLSVFIVIWSRYHRRLCRMRRREPAVADTSRGDLTRRDAA